MSSVIYYWTDARQHGIYLLNNNVHDDSDENDDDNNLTQVSDLLSLAKSSLLIGETSNQTKSSDMKSNKMLAFGKREKPY